MKQLPIALATAAIVVTQIACTYVIVQERPTGQIFVEHVDQVVYDGQVVSANLHGGSADRVVLTRQAALGFLRELAVLFATQDVTAPSDL